MEARSLPEALKLIMRQRGWSQTQLARELRRYPSWVSEVIAGEKGTNFAKVIKLLERVGWEVRITPEGEELDPVKRRDFTANVGKAFVAGAVGNAASVMFVSSSNVPPFREPPYVRGLAGRLRDNLFEHGGGSLVQPAIRQARTVAASIGEIDRPDRELLAAAADLTQMSTAVLCDARRFDAAENVGELAVGFARAAADPEEQARAYNHLAELNIDRVRAERAVMYARRGLRLSGVSDLQRAWLNVRLAVGLALMREQEREALEALEQVQIFLADAQSSGSVSADLAGDMAGEIGIALASLGRYQDAHASLDHAVTLTAQSSPFLQGCFLGRRVETALRDSKPDMATDLMLSLARVAPMINSVRLDEHVHSSLRLSSRWAAMPEMREARDRLRSVMPPGTKTG